MSTIRGRTAVRAIKSLFIAKGNATSAIAYAESQNWLDAKSVVATLKTAIDPGTTTSIGWASDYVPTPAALDFAEMVRPLTILGKLEGLRRVPGRVRSIAATSGSTAYWSGEKQPRPISKLVLDGETLEPLSVVAMCVTTEELLKSSSPDAEVALARDLAAATAAAMDQAFVDPDNAGSSAKPAAVTNGVTPISSTGRTLAAIDTDLAQMVDALTAAGSDLMNAAWVLNPRTALFLARLRGTGGALAHPGMTAKGGTLLGLPAVTSAHVPIETVGSPGFLDTSLALVDAGQILVADDGAADFAVSRHGAIEMTDAPSGGTTSLVSMFQSNSVCLRAIRFANWRRCRDGMAQVLVGVDY